jgi:bifunctional oligoribonuclease and PAP phosphatase NrnA
VSPAHDGAAREQVLEHIRDDSKFVLATHENPDGDALGSLVGMHELLGAIGKESDIFISGDDLPLPPEYRMFDLRGAISAPPADIAERTVVFLDCGNIDRNSASVLRSGASLLNIDHHHDNTLFGTLDYVVPSASSTAEIVWDLMHALGVTPSPAAVEALYIGLITDTGRFMYENTGPRAHLMAADLIEAGVDVQRVYRALYEDVPPEKLSLMARALGDVRRFDDGELTLASLSAQDYESTDAEEHYSEGIVDQLRAVQGTKVAVLVRELISGERRGQRKVSLRAADDDVDVSLIARAQGGGGHRRAAGFSTTLDVDELIAFLRSEIAAQRDRAAGGRATATLA